MGCCSGCETNTGCGTGCSGTGCSALPYLLPPATGCGYSGLVPGLFGPGTGCPIGPLGPPILPPSSPLFGAQVAPWLVSAGTGQLIRGAPRGAFAPAVAVQRPVNPFVPPPRVAPAPPVEVSITPGSFTNRLTQSQYARVLPGGQYMYAEINNPHATAMSVIPVGAIVQIFETVNGRIYFPEWSPDRLSRNPFKPDSVGHSWGIGPVTKARYNAPDGSVHVGWLETHFIQPIDLSSPGGPPLTPPTGTGQFRAAPAPFVQPEYVVAVPPVAVQTRPPAFVSPAVEVQPRPPPFVFSASPPGGGTLHPPPGTRAVVSVGTGEQGLNLRSSPNPNVNNIIGAVYNGTTVIVLQSNLLEEGKSAASPERWWQVRSPSGDGYIRVVGPRGEWNVKGV